MSSDNILRNLAGVAVLQKIHIKTGKNLNTESANVIRHYGASHHDPY